MRKLMAALILVTVPAAGGCIFVDDGPNVHHHCVGCGHVYVKGGYWR